jgi:hypothetical protein
LSRNAFAAINWALSVPPILLPNGRIDDDAHHVLVVLATRAKPDGTDARPGNDWLARKSYRSPESVARCLEACQAHGLISKAADLNGTTVWTLNMEVTSHGKTVIDERQDRQRAGDARRQQRSRRHRAGDHSLCLADRCPAVGQEGVETVERHGGEGRDVTVPKGVTSHGGDGRDVTVGKGVTHGGEGRDVTGGTPLHPQVTPGVTALRTAHELPKEQTSPPDGVEERADVEALCTRLRDRMIANGDKVPPISKQWRDEARRLLDIDKRPLDKALALIDWATADAFWRANVRSMPKFRKQYDQLRHRANEEWQKRNSSRVQDWQDLKHDPKPSPDSRVAGWQALKTGTEQLPVIFAVPETRALPKGGSQ